MEQIAPTSGDLSSQAGPLLVLAGWAVAGLAALLWRLPRIRETTLVAPWCWSLAVLVALAASELAVGLAAATTPAWAAHLRFAAAMTTVCPVMALLGAKRPQHVGWQFVVVSLLAILCLPSIEWLLFGGRAELHPARFWFLAVLIGIGALNGLPTRYWPSSLLYAGGQAVLIVPFFTEHELLERFPAPLIGFSAIVSAWLLIAGDWPRARGVKLPPDRVWLDFRDAFRAVWALRIAERMNASATMYHWPVTLRWGGFRIATAAEMPDAPGGSSTRAPEDAPTDDIPPAVVESLRTLLRRFVSQPWIDERLATQAPEPAPQSIAL